MVHTEGDVYVTDVEQYSLGTGSFMFIEWVVRKICGYVLAVYDNKVANQLIHIFIVCKIAKKSSHLSNEEFHIHQHSCNFLMRLENTGPIKIA